MPSRSGSCLRAVTGELGVELDTSDLRNARVQFSDALHHGACAFASCTQLLCDVGIDALVTLMSVTSNSPHVRSRRCGPRNTSPCCHRRRYFRAAESFCADMMQACDPLALDAYGVKVLELCTALLVDASGASRDGDDQVFHSRFGDDPHLVGTCWVFSAIRCTALLMVVSGKR